MDSMDTLTRVALIFVPFLFALCFHEYAHAWMAKKLGDNTADDLGRLTLNPLSHADPLGTFFFPIMAIVSGGGFFFGWAKPVPVNPRNLKHPLKDMFWVALAGPGSNILLGVIGALALGTMAVVLNAHPMLQSLSSPLAFFIKINLFLAVFNLIPIHPLDGGKILARFLPYNANRWLEQNSGTLSMIFLGLILMSAFSGEGLFFLTWPTEALYNLLMILAGVWAQILDIIV